MCYKVTLTIIHKVTHISRKKCDISVFHQAMSRSALLRKSQWNVFCDFERVFASKQELNANAVPERKFTPILRPEIAHGIPL